MTSNSESVRAIVYARVSTSEQARSDATSLDSQIDRGRSYAAAKGWEVVAELRDRGVSGAVPFADRAAGEEAIRLIESGEAERLIVLKIDRFTRSAATGLTDMDRLEDQGARIVFVEEAIDTSTPMGRMFRTIVAAFAEFERETIAERMDSGRNAAILGGRLSALPGRTLFGYEWNEEGTRRVAKPEEAETIRRIFELRASGRSRDEIATVLRAEKRPTPPTSRDRAPYDWASRTIGNYLRDTRFMGVSETKQVDGEEVEVPYEAIVDESLFRRAARTTEALDPGIPRNRQRRYTLSSNGPRLFHEHPDGEHHSMYGETSRGSRAHKTYRCTTSRSDNRQECPGFGRHPRGGKTITTVKAAIVEAAALGALLRVALVTSERDAFVARLREEAAAEAEEAGVPSVVAIDARLDEISQTRGSLARLHAEGVLDRSELDHQINDLRTEEDRLHGWRDQALVAEERDELASYVADGLRTYLTYVVDDAAEESGAILSADEGWFETAGHDELADATTRQLSDIDDPDSRQVLGAAVAEWIRVRDLGGVTHLSDWATEALSTLLDVFDAKVVVKSREDPGDFTVLPIPDGGVPAWYPAFAVYGGELAATERLNGHVDGRFDLPQSNLGSGYRFPGLGARRTAAGGVP